jgi:hypothetical protein
VPFRLSTISSTTLKATWFVLSRGKQCFSSASAIVRTIDWARFAFDEPGLKPPSTVIFVLT